jgi:hypothetical protein
MSAPGDKHRNRLSAELGDLALGVNGLWRFFYLTSLTSLWLVNIQPSPWCHHQRAHSLHVCDRRGCPCCSLLLGLTTSKEMSNRYNCHPWGKDNMAAVCPTPWLSGSTGALYDISVCLMLRKTSIALIKSFLYFVSKEGRGGHSGRRCSGLPTLGNCFHLKL